MQLLKTIQKLCKPAYVYLVLSVIAIILLMFQNKANSNVYCVGKMTCNVPSTPLVFAAKIIYTIFWTFVLNSICKAGYPAFSWFMVLLPFVLFFIALTSLIFLQNNNIEGLIVNPAPQEEDKKCECGGDDCKCNKDGVKVVD